MDLLGLLLFGTLLTLVRPRREMDAREIEPEPEHDGEPHVRARELHGMMKRGLEKEHS